MKTSIPRLRRIRFKDGRTIEVIRPKGSDVNYFKRVLGETVNLHLDGANGPCGIAVVMWDSHGFTTCKVFNETAIPGILVPDLVRNVMLGNKIEAWTLDTLNGD